MRYQEIVEAQVIDFNPQVTRHLFDLDLAASRGSLAEKLHKGFRQFLFANKDKSIRLYHGTSVKHDVAGQGLLPTSRRRRLSLQSGSGYVYLSYDPMRALSFASAGYPTDKTLVIYAVEVPIRDLKPDGDQLRNKRGVMDIARSAIASQTVLSMVVGRACEAQSGHIRSVYMAILIARENVLRRKLYLLPSEWHDCPVIRQQIRL